MATEAFNVDIFYVEDDDVDIQAVRRKFHQINNHLKIDAATDGKTALDKLHGRGGREKIIPKVILLDLNMPKMNGIEFLKALRQDFRDAKVFVLTGAFNTEEKLALRPLKVSGCIIKPLEHADALNILWCVNSDPQSATLLF
ncbi:response regulator [Legionella impletisoli]|uniref:Response regulator n=1 Tax=Legionella impletisoli TaxID=343510 RepID=A0A917JSI2_9GAMM|nr:response regulator [Legionella impletisoli]GGI84020.1 response regulator [Legionella impletisoli]